MSASKDISTLQNSVRTGVEAGSDVEGVRRDLKPSVVEKGKAVGRLIFRGC